MGFSSKNESNKFLKPCKLSASLTSRGKELHNLPLCCAKKNTSVFALSLLIFLHENMREEQGPGTRMLVWRGRIQAK